MPTFWDLPKNVRDIIYRHHLVYDEPVTIRVHRQAIGCVKYWDNKKYMPPIFHLSKKAEREAIPFFYEMNVFDIGNLHVHFFTSITWPRHWNRVKRVISEWTSDGSGWGHCGMTREAFISLGRMKKLEELNIRIDETKMLDRMPIKREVRQRPCSLLELTSQQNLAILRFPGVTETFNLRALRIVANLDYINPVFAGASKFEWLEKETAYCQYEDSNPLESKIFSSSISLLCKDRFGIYSSYVSGHSIGRPLFM